MINDSSKAVFLSYASDDREAANHIAEALRGAGIEAWFDQSELRGGDAWDAKIRAQIRTCALFLAVISKNTRARDEGYFRLEWKLAVDRSYLMSQNRAFIVPVAIDATRESENVPDRFREVQWMRLPDGAPLQPLVDQVKRLLSNAPASPDTAGSSSVPDVKGGWSRRTLGVAACVLIILSGVALGLRRHVYSSDAPKGTIAAQATPAFKPPEHSIAVMPFQNLSGDPAQEYFSDGVSEELLEALARLQGLQVAARSSSFSFKGKSDTPIDIARKLNVATLLEGSVRRAGSKVRIAAQLVDAITGFEIWSQTFDRELNDILALQAEIATAVTQSLRIKLTPDQTDIVQAGGTHNSKALDLYLKSLQLNTNLTHQNSEESLALLTEAIALDPNFADAYAGRSWVEANLAGYFDPTERIESRHAEERSDIETALRLAPQLANYYSRYAQVLATDFLDLRGGQEQFAKAAALAPDDARIMSARAGFENKLGHRAEAADLTRRVLQMNPSSTFAYYNAAVVFANAGYFEEALSNADHAKTLGVSQSISPRCRALLGLHRYDEIVRDCPPNDGYMQATLAVALMRLNRIADAHAMFDRLFKENGDAAAYQYAEIYAQWGEKEKALTWLEKAYAVKDGGLVDMQVDFMVDPIRDEPRFHTVLHKMNFPP
jgi:TolB-like protein